MARTPQNDFTRMLERVSAGNAAGEFGGSGASLASPRPTVSSAALGREVQEAAPLSAQERFELDQKAMELGLVPPGAVGGEQVMYETMDDALRAAGIDPDAPPAPTVDPVEALAARTNFGGALRPDLAQRRYATPVPEVRVVETARFPDFTKVQGMDLQKGVVYLDSIEFQIPPANLQKLRQFVVELAKRTLMEKLEEAVGLFAREVPSGSGAAQGTGTAVQRLPEGGSS